MTKIGVTILGSTGSVGKNTLAVIAKNQALFKVIALTAHTSYSLLFEQMVQFQPKYVVMTDQCAAQALRDLIKMHGLTTKLLSPKEGLSFIVQEPAVTKVVAAMVGSIGLLPIFEAIKAGKQILFANKEPLVMAGEWLVSQAMQHRATIIPLDSEHNALFQCLPQDYQIGTPPQDVLRFILTASGGPFLQTANEELKNVTPKMACQHPNWTMGKKISVDCATLMNKGLEVIEASCLFSVPVSQIDVLIHPQSIIHSMVEFRDGSILSQMGPTDMKVPISYGLAWPKRMNSAVPKLSFDNVRNLTFMPPDREKFKCLDLAYQAANLGMSATIALNASNEVAVSSFLNNQIPFLQIATIIETVLSGVNRSFPSSIEEVIDLDLFYKKQTIKMISANKKQYAI